MTRFYFHLNECGDQTLDEEGLELGSIEEARHQAMRCAREIMADEVSQGRLCLSCNIRIADASGSTVLMLPFREVLAVSGL